MRMVHLTPVDLSTRLVVQQTRPAVPLEIHPFDHTKSSRAD
jgi:hypothetical protein